MAKALLTNCAPRVIRIVNANPDAWSQNVSGQIGAFPDDQEITAAILEADEMVVTRGYFQSVNAALAEGFMNFSTNIPHGGKLPFHYGRHGKVELSSNALFTGAQLGFKVNSADDIKSILAFGASYVGSGNFDHLYFIDDDNYFYHPAQFGRVEIPIFARTNALQANQSEETLIIATSVRILTKNASPAPFKNYTDESVRGIDQLVTDGKYTEEG